jgi:hypothetical protein
VSGTLTCPACGYSWWSVARSQQTRCGQCHGSLYVPARVRNAGQVLPSGAVYPVERRPTEAPAATAQAPSQVRPTPTPSPPRPPGPTPAYVRAAVELDYAPAPAPAPAPVAVEPETAPAGATVTTRLRERIRAAVPAPTPNAGRDAFRHAVESSGFVALVTLGCGHEVALPSERPAQWSGLVSCPTCREPVPYRSRRTTAADAVPEGAIHGAYVVS